MKTDQLGDNGDGVGRGGNVDELEDLGSGTKKKRETANVFVVEVAECADLPEDGERILGVCHLLDSDYLATLRILEEREKERRTSL